MLTPAGVRPHLCLRSASHRPIRGLVQTYPSQTEIQSVHYLIQQIHPNPKVSICGEKHVLRRRIILARFSFLLALSPSEEMGTCKISYECDVAIQA
jgi:hypothetical protein